ncbi:DUF4913 domain-containing protein [Nocardia salmonicida]|uniref:DUF4913 domain-containing protein n=1 Tax=Nocardia salmonicida TaxID=53431 RepID=UPI003797BE4B
MTTTENTTELINTALQRAVDSELAAIAQAMAKDALSDMLTPEVRAEMVEAARHQVELALNPPAETETEAEEDEGAQAESKPEPFYKTVVDFVENFVAINYRRDVNGHNSRVPWCPEWWRHGEVKGRFTALWMAFETLRMGKKLEQSLFWINHFDPMMTRILDPEGPFKHCSPREGHKGLYSVLPTMPADAAVADPRSIPGVDDSGWTQRSSKIWAPNTFDAERPAREVQGFPE